MADNVDINSLQLPYGTVTHQFLSVLSDGPDENLEPDVSSIPNLVVTFTPTTKLVVWNDNGRYVTFRPSVVKAMYDNNGNLRPVSQGAAIPNANLRLLCTTGDSMQPSGWAWKASFGTPSIPEVSFSLQPGQELDLSSILLSQSTPNSAQVYADLIAAAKSVSDALAKAEAANFKGPKGDRGDKGDPGVSNVVFVRGTSIADIPAGIPANTLVVLRSA